MIRAELNGDIRKKKRLNFCVVISENLNWKRPRSWKNESRKLSKNSLLWNLSYKWGEVKNLENIDSEYSAKEIVKGYEKNNRKFNLFEGKTIVPTDFTPSIVLS